MWIMKKYKFNYIIVTRLVKTFNCYLKVGRDVVLIDEYIIWFTKEHSIIRSVCTKCAIVSWKFFSHTAAESWSYYQQIFQSIFICILRIFILCSIYTTWKMFLLKTSKGRWHDFLFMGRVKFWCIINTCQRSQNRGSDWMCVANLSDLGMKWSYFLEHRGWNDRSESVGMDTWILVVDKWLIWESRDGHIYP